MLQYRFQPLTRGLLALMIGGVTWLSVSPAQAAPAADDLRLLGQVVAPGDLWSFDWEWRRTDHIDGTRLEPDDSSRYSLDFSPDGGIHVQADCNMADGSYAYEGWMLGLQLNKVTKIRCPNGSHSAAFLRDLGSVVSQAADGNDLVLVMRTGGAMRFARSSEPWLGGPPWLLSQYLASDGRFYSPEEGLNVNIRFGNNEQVVGRTGCNSFEGRYLQQNNAIDFRGMTSTKRLCEPYVMRFEEGFKSYLSRAAHYWQIGDQLTFLDENHQPLMIFARAGA